MVQIVIKLVKKHISQPPAEDDTDGAVKQRIIHVFGFPALVRLSPGSILAKPQDANEGDQIHEPLPVYAQRADGVGDGVKLRLDKNIFQTFLCKQQKTT